MGGRRAWIALALAVIGQAGLAQPIVVPSAPPPPAMQPPIINAPPVQIAPGGTVGVIMRVVLDPTGKPTEAEVFRTIALGPGQTPQGAVALPHDYVSAIRAKLMAMRFAPAPQAFRFFVFDPERPKRIDLGPEPRLVED